MFTSIDDAWHQECFEEIRYLFPVTSHTYFFKEYAWLYYTKRAHFYTILFGMRSMTCLLRTTCHESINVWINGVQRALAISISKLFGNSRQTEAKGDALIKGLIIRLGSRTLFPSTQLEWQCRYLRGRFSPNIQIK